MIASETAVGAFERAEDLLKLRHIPQALTAYDEAQKGGYPADRCAGARWICHMLLGDFKAAWQESDLIAQTGAPDPHRFWDGRSFRHRRILIRCLHGLGDTVQYARFLPQVRREAAFLCVEAQPPLRQLLAEAGVADQVITWGEPEPAWDQQIEIVELPRILRVTSDMLAGGERYLDLPNLDLPKFPRLPSGSVPRRIGLVWASSAFNPARSIPLSLLARVCETENARFFSLQGEPERAQLAISPARIEDCFDPSLAEAARRLTSLDLLITVDTALAHLAGALGIPVWTLLPFEADWRWMLGRSDTPWYGTMRLFRQPQRGDWLSVIGQVQAALCNWTPRPSTAINPADQVPAK